MTFIEVRVPTRVDLAGGTLDLWPIHTLMRKAATVNFGITIYQTAKICLASDHTDKSINVSSLDLSERFCCEFEDLHVGTNLLLLRELIQQFWDGSLPGFTLTTMCGSPAGAGLGGSSCLSIAIASALIHARHMLDDKFEQPREEKLVETVQNVEAKIIRTPTGCQDYWGGIRGRVNVLDFRKSGLEIETFYDDEIKSRFDERMLVVYCGKSRQSAMNNWQIFKNVFDGDKQTLQVLSDIGELGFRVGQALKESDIDSALSYSQQEWELRKALWSGVETQETKKIDIAAKDNGAAFSRVCGAGGGGVMVVFCENRLREQVSSAIKSAGGIILDAAIDSGGVDVAVKHGKSHSLSCSQYA